jgi:hypothetical protein
MQKIQITDHRKQLGRCPECGDEKVKLSELVEYKGICKNCYEANRGEGDS